MQISLAKAQIQVRCCGRYQVDQLQKATDINGKVIADLNKSYQERLKFDPSLKKYVVETEELKNNLSHTRVSLNETKRKAEMEEQKKREASEKLDTKIGLIKKELHKIYSNSMMSI